MDLPTALYEPAGDGRWRATDLTIGPWDAGAQHGGPPAALLAREVERATGIPTGQTVRLAFDILGPVPVGEVRVEARVLRPGRRVELVEATLDAGGRPLMRVTAWRMRAAEGPVAAETPPGHGPDDGQRMVLDVFPREVAYHRALEWRLVAGGGFEVPGPATAWTRPDCTLVPEEPISPLQHLLVMTDASSGLSSVLDWTTTNFANVDLVVALRRPPRGEWLCTDAVTHLGGAGTAQCFAALYDAEGLVGRSTQSLLVEPR
ncbi:thioesterase family protein [Geodermatophilus sp. YIM 151500]|uniref:thioesterase family protein n=1 Tax=Geodermatophilus sp. YIM 151500 TaxID=2984531 RepID=UPI0021E37C54|nr:thioesterase family protein [Geodermatophilus sp. YIM 151500]MCV2491853.1 thioesterase family protein [Geodermatophilus sp. YIM 151500]